MCSWRTAIIATSLITERKTITVTVLNGEMKGVITIPVLCKMLCYQCCQFLFLSGLASSRIPNKAINVALLAFHLLLRHLAAAIGF